MSREDQIRIVNIFALKVYALGTENDFKSLCFMTIWLHTQPKTGLCNHFFMSWQTEGNSQQSDFCQSYDEMWEFWWWCLSLLLTTSCRKETVSALHYSQWPYWSFVTKTGEKMGMEIWQAEAVFACMGEMTFMQANWLYKVKREIIINIMFCDFETMVRRISLWVLSQ